MSENFSANESLKELKKLSEKDNYNFEIPDDVSKLPGLESSQGMFPSCLEITVKYEDEADLKELLLHLANFTNNIKNDKFVAFKLDSWSDITIPPEIGLFKNLTTLDMQYANAQSISEDIGNLKTLKNLYLSKNNLSDLPDFSSLTNLEDLKLAKNKLESLPKGIDKLKKLKKLDVEKNELTCLPEDIGNLVLLEKFKIKDNKLISLPASIGSLEHLPELDLSKNELVTFPPEIGLMKNLLKLFATDNAIEYLPSEIGNLENLKLLWLGNNRLTTLPDEITQLKSLMGLGLQNNNFSSEEENKITAQLDFSPAF